MVTAMTCQSHDRQATNILNRGEIEGRIVSEGEGQLSLRRPSENGVWVGYCGDRLQAPASLKPELLATQTYVPNRPKDDRLETSTRIQQSDSVVVQYGRFGQRLDMMNWSLQCISSLTALLNSNVAKTCDLKPLDGFRVSTEHAKNNYVSIHGSKVHGLTSRPKNLTKIKPPVGSSQDYMNPRDCRLQEKVAPKCQTNHNMSPDFPNAPARPYVRVMHINSDQKDQISQTATTQRINQAFVAILGSMNLPSAMKLTPGSKQLFSESIPAEVSSKDDRLRFRASLARFSRKIRFHRDCPKFSRTTLRQEEKQADNSHDFDLDTRRAMEQAIVDINLEQMAKYMREETEKRRREAIIQEEIESRNRELAFQAEAKQIADKAVGGPYGIDDFPAEEVDASCNFAPVFEVNLAEADEEGEEEENPREIDVQPSDVSTISHRDARLAQMIRDESIKRQREELKRDEMKSLMDKTKMSIRQARAKFLQQEAKRKEKQIEEHRRNQLKYGCCDNNSYRIDLCRHFQCITQGINEISKQTLRHDRITNLYGGSDEVDELADVDPVEKEHVIEISPQREGEIGDHFIGEDQPEYYDPYGTSGRDDLEKETSRISDREEIERKMEATLSKMKNVLSEVTDPDEEQGSTWRPSQPRSTHSTQSSKKVINLYSRTKLDSTDHLVNISSFIRESSRSATKPRNKKSVHFAD